MVIRYLLNKPILSVYVRRKGLHAQRMAIWRDMERTFWLILLRQYFAMLAKYLCNVWLNEHIGLLFITTTAPASSIMHSCWGNVGYTWQKFCIPQEQRILKKNRSQYVAKEHASTCFNPKYNSVLYFYSVLLQLLPYVPICLSNNEFSHKLTVFYEQNVWHFFQYPYYTYTAQRLRS